MKLTLVGDTSVGKSAIIKRLRGSHLHPTEIIEAGRKFWIVIEDMYKAGQMVELRIYELEGDKSQDVDWWSIHLSEADAIFLVYDIRNIDAVSGLKDWITRITDYYTSQPDEMSMYLTRIQILANKTDLLDEDLPIMVVDTEELVSAINPDLSRQLQIEVTTTSAKTGLNNYALFESVVLHYLYLQKN